MGDFDANRDLYRNAVATLLQPFAEVVDEIEGMGPLDEHPEISENEPYSLWILIQELREKGVEIEDQGIMEYLDI